METMFDLVIRAGMVADGLGNPLFEADIAVRDGRIVEVGKVLGSAKEEIDARGLVVTPGFVDVHTHYDGQAMWDSRLASSSWNGVTTVVMGNCGVGFAPVRTQDRERLIELMEGVEDIPGAVLHEGLDWQWESFGEYLAALERRPHDIDICAQLPHGALRVYVMGERATRLEAATADDVAQMRILAAEAMHAGAIGFSTSRTINHRTLNGDPTPSLRAAEDELMGIAMGLKDAGRGVIALITDFDTPDLETEFAMMRRIVEQSGRPMSFSLAQQTHRKESWRQLLALTADAVEAGLPMRAQVAPRPIGTLLGLQASLNPFFECASYMGIAHEPLAQRLALLKDAGLRQRLLEEIELPPKSGLARHLTSFGMIFPLGNPANYEPNRDTSIAAQAARQGRKPAELAYDMLLEDEGRSFLYAPFANYADFNLDACGEMIADPNTVMGLGDGGAHVGVVCDASFPSYLLTHWGRDRESGKFALSWLVKRQTSDTARAVGLFDRGVIAPGMKADLNVIDMDRLGLDQPQMHFDLPAGGKRLLQGARGYVATIVSGVPIYREGKATGALPGRLVRGPQKSDSAAL
ncbi:amidohydrolase family protein [Pseudomonas sp. TH41]|uniref:N-acyl-D-amino-acid deacylase family protein n=1 Tax=Pseudomonas sp. TH41 TaxID=2796405 RepID=UPI0019147FC3|nr:amidohydrolase family protein [Pseudomonas sp. TH41]MBK5356581.1 amidohydrolase family protein [Pseudomonas sp. TH41]